MKHNGNQKGLYFEDVSRKIGLSEGTYADVKWGVGMPDLNNDGHLDVFIACGHLIDNVDLFDDSTRYKALNILMENTGQGRFTKRQGGAGTGMNIRESSRGAVFDDLDNDGDIDVVILNAREQPSVLMNETSSPNHWLQVSLEGQTSNRDGVGARVSIVAKGVSQIQEKYSGRGYQSDYGKRLHFGLGMAEEIESLTVQWPSGQRDKFLALPVDRHILVREGSQTLKVIQVESQR